MKDIQAYYRKEMDRRGYGPMTFGLDEADNDLINIHLVRGKLLYQDYSVKSGHDIRGEVVPELAKKGIDANRSTIVLFCSDPAAFAPDYRRYLLSVLRDQLPFGEVPIKMYLHKRHRKDEGPPED